MSSFQAAYTAPIIMMSQNRQATIDRQDAKYDSEVNKKAELEIELLHDKMNLLRESEIVEIIQIIQQHQEQLQRIKSKVTEISNRLIDE